MKERILELFEAGASPTEIARQTAVSYSSVYGLTTVRARGFRSVHKYQEDLARQRGFNSLAEYRMHISQGRGYDSHHAYRVELVQEKGFQSWHDYNEHLAQRQGFSSRHEYDESLALLRTERKENRDMSELITRRLRALDKNQTWLADQIGVSTQSVSNYAKGKSIPRADNLNRLLRVLEVPSIDS